MFNKYFNKDELGIENKEVSPKSAMLASGILGGMAVLVMLSILIFMLCKNHKQRLRTRVHLPLPISSDSSTSSTPPIYGTRTTIPKGPYKSSGFWGTLKKRFDPYSLSSTPTSMK